MNQLALPNLSAPRPVTEADVDRFALAPGDLAASDANPAIAPPA